MALRKWEYKAEYANRESVDEVYLNAAGEDGWELVAVMAGPCSYAWYYFKRDAGEVRDGA